MPFISINGINTHFLHFGNEKSKNPSVIFIHGAGQSSVCWKFQYNLFKIIDHFNFIYIDLPGHGKSDGVGFTKIKEYSDLLHSFINKMNIEEYVLIGHSMGGRISQVNIIDYPEHAIGSVLAGTGSRIRVTKYTMDTAKKSLSDFAELAADNSFSKMAPIELKTEFKSWLLNSRQETIINDLKACNEFDTSGEVSEIDVPTCIIAGEEDILAPIGHSLHLKNVIPNSSIERIKGAGHFMMIEKPAEFNKLVVDFINFIK